MRMAAIAFPVAMLAFGPSSADDKFAEAVKQYQEGLLSEAVVAFDAVIRARLGDPASKPELIGAYLYKGAAHVGLQQEEAAREAFRFALAADPTTRMKRGDFPDRVYRVFEAARTGKAKSVMERPSDAPKKAGIGAAGILAIVGGGVALAGGTVALASSNGDATAPPATVATTTLPAAVTPLGTFGVGGTFSFVNAAPPPGATISGCGSGTGCPPVAVVFRLAFTRTARPGFNSLRGGLYREVNPPSQGIADACLGNGVLTNANSGDTFDFQLSFSVTAAGRCGLPLRIQSMRVCYYETREEFCQDFSIHYQFSP